MWSSYDIVDKDHLRSDFIPEDKIVFSLVDQCSATIQRSADQQMGVILCGFTRGVPQV